MLPDTGREEVANINEEIERLSALTYRVNDYLRDARGRPETVRICDFLLETSKRLLGRAALSGPVSDGLLVYIDPERARSVFENLIRNAIESGGRIEDIAVSIDKRDKNIVISVSDQGRGIDPEKLKQVFDPFYTSKSKGTGIGLSICKRFVEAAGGSIAIKNRQSGGVEAEVILPEQEEK
jgi:two-component system sensor histidine kinase HydH